MKEWERAYARETKVRKAKWNGETRGRTERELTYRRVEAVDTVWAVERRVLSERVAIRAAGATRKKHIHARRGWTRGPHKSRTVCGTFTRPTPRRRRRTDTNLQQNGEMVRRHETQQRQRITIRIWRDVSVWMLSVTSLGCSLTRPDACSRHPTQKRHELMKETQLMAVAQMKVAGLAACGGSCGSVRSSRNPMRRSANCPVKVQDISRTVNFCNSVVGEYLESCRRALWQALVAVYSCVGIVRGKRRYLAAETVSTCVYATWRCCDTTVGSRAIPLI